MPQYKFSYFNARGFGETARMLFALADQEYEDVRYTREQWLEVKASTPFGQMPLLEVDGVKLSQSVAIYRFLARRFGLAGKTDLDEGRGDMIVDCIKDITQPLMRIHSESDAEKKDELKKAHEEDTLPNQIVKLEQLLGDQEFFLGDITWADVVFYNSMSWYPLMGISVPWDKIPKLQKLKERVENNPKIAEWIKKRPVTEH